MDNNYTPFAHKYRPKQFVDISGQDVLIKTLTNAISKDLLVNAYLLSGIRGVGKTSAARIIAKTVNCTDLLVENNQILHCNKCPNCISFNSKNHMDVIEIDAASKTGVDDIREVIENSQYKPVMGKIKFFIIDEVHMLSQGAFNALLKIVEEPPEHVIFIFATTELQKLPLTFISRCQRYNLRRLTIDELSDIMMKIIQNEKNITADNTALKLIAMKAEGSARDAVVILDQAVSYANGQKITTETICNMLSIIDLSYVVRMMQYIIACDLDTSSKILEEVYQQVNNLLYFFQDISDFITELTKFKLIKNYKNTLYSDYKKEIDAILLGTPLSKLSVLFQIFSSGLVEMKATHNEFNVAQMIIVKAIYANKLPSIEQLQNLAAESNLNVFESSSTSSNEASLETSLKPSLETSLEPPTIEKSTIEQSKVDNIIVDTTSKESYKLISDFLKYCYQKNEMNIYYTLLRQVEIVEFENNCMVIGSENLDSNFKNSITQLLNSWSSSTIDDNNNPNSWTLKILPQNKITPLRDKMLQKVKASEDYHIIQKYFPSMKISDILLDV